MSEEKKKLSPLAYESVDGVDYPSYVPPQRRMKEFSVRAIVLGVILAVILGAANAYLGLKVGMTVSASIPAAVISMGILRGLLRRGTILENNMVQTIGSAGESIAAGVIFTIPALYMLGLAPKLITVTLMAGLGGTLGLLMMIPLRRAVMVEEHGKLPFPEGTACAEVLVAGEVGGGSARTLFASMGVAGLFRFAQNGLKLFPESIECAISGFSGAMLGVDILPSLMGVGFIIGMRISSAMLTGSIISWLCIIPLIKFFGAESSAIFPSEMPISEMGPWDLWNNYIRYIGAGAVAFGGIISFVEALPTIFRSFKRVLETFSLKRVGIDIRTQQDLPGAVVVIGSLLIALAMLFILPIDSMIGRILAAVSVVVFSFF
ncbi:MAG: oligopeptide transporter, OPT family, partial [Candidatus Fermentibacteria bacterium]|nr:oligopeptide transporter, OPT family [Candidatus Fermentibacteria bacterium]